MKKNEKRMLMVLSAAACMVLGTSFAAYAKGWERLEDGSWIYLDSYGDRVSCQWEKSGDLYFWLDDDGIMATDQIVDDGGNIYYVDSAGARVYNRWISVENQDDDEVNGNDVETLWYYFGSSGKAYRSEGDLIKKTVGDGVYFFDEDGRMASGWVDYSGEAYYCGGENQGWAQSGWQYLEPKEEIRDVYDDMEWFYFGDGYKMRKSTSSYINNAYYSFDQNGVMQDDWYTVDGVGSYAAEDGSLSSGWLYTTDSNDDEYNWYYMVTVRENGKAIRSVPFNSINTDRLMRAKTINGKTYLFEPDGTMVTGLVELSYDTSSTSADGASCKKLEAGTYLFSEEEGSNNGKMMTGKVTYNDEGDVSYYYFGSDGKAVTAQLRDGIVYGDDGRRIQAEDGNTYTTVRLSYPIQDTSGNVKIAAGTTFIVSSSGKLKTSGSVKIDGEYYVINSSTYEAVLDTSR